MEKPLIWSWNMTFPFNSRFCRCLLTVFILFSGPLRLPGWMAMAVMRPDSWKRGESLITTIIAACAGLIAAILAVWILPRFLEVPEDPSKPDILIRLSFLLPIPYAVIGFVQRNTLGFSELAFAGTVLWFLYVFAVTDIRKKIILIRRLYMVMTILLKQFY